MPSKVAYLVSRVGSWTGALSQRELAPCLKQPAVPVQVSKPGTKNSFDDRIPSLRKTKSNNSAADVHGKQLSAAPLQPGRHMDCT